MDALGSWGSGRVAGRTGGTVIRMPRVGCETDVGSARGTRAGSGSSMGTGSGVGAVTCQWWWSPNTTRRWWACGGLWFDRRAVLDRQLGIVWMSLENVLV